MSSDEVREVIASLREGDEVEVTYRGEYEDRHPTKGDFWTKDGIFHPVRGIAEVRVIKRVEPPCPFPMGAKVRGKNCPTCRVLTVTGWDYYPAWGKWFLRCESGKVDDEGEREYALMNEWELELVPEVPEPPAGTPVWWDGRWWYKPPAQDVYLPLDWRGKAQWWAFMPGAVPAATPEEEK